MDTPTVSAMVFLISGLALWSIAHLFPILASTFRLRFVQAIGINAYRGMFAGIVLASVTAMVFGWRSADPVQIYDPPAWGVTVNHLLMVGAVLLFVSSFLRNNVRRFVRHPQLLAVVIWATGHLMVSGAFRSVILFGSLAVWAVIAIAGINRRDGAWDKPPKAPVLKDVALLGFGGAGYVALAFVHPRLLDISVVVGWVLP